MKYYNLRTAKQIITILLFLSLYSAGQTGNAIFTNQVPALTVNDNLGFELGVRFRSKKDGKITKVRLYRSSNLITGIHKIRIWRVEDNSLLIGPIDWDVTNEGLGWIEKNLPSSVPIDSETEYLLSIDNAGGYYTKTEYAFNSPINNGDLITYSASGVYGSMGKMPTKVYNNSNYFRDIVFVPNTVMLFNAEVPSQFNSDAQYELGTKFNLLSNGYFKKVRIYASASESGIHKVRIWEMNGLNYNLVGGPYDWNLQSGLDGWKEYELPFPIRGFLGRTYVVSVSNSSTDMKYAVTQNFTGVANNVNLQYVSGVYTNILGDPPIYSYSGSAYFRDVVFDSEARQSDLYYQITTNQKPQGYNNEANYNLGTKFISLKDGYISKVKLYTSKEEEGVHDVAIWEKNNGSFTNITGILTWDLKKGVEGWREFTLPVNLKIKSNTEYIVAITNGPDKNYAKLENGFVLNSTNGFLRYMGGFYSSLAPYSSNVPNQTFNNSFYFRDVEFRTAVKKEESESNIMDNKIPLASSNDAQYELGTRFSTLVDGSISKVYIYKLSAESGTHIVRIWKKGSGAYTVVAGPYNWNVQGVNEEWIEFALPTPLNVVNGTEYIVSVSTSQDQYYPKTPNYFTSDRTNKYIQTFQGSGVYSTILNNVPLSTYNNSNYYRDIEFTPNCSSGKTLVLVNSSSTSYVHFKKYIQPYLDNFGVSYDIHDVNSGPPPGFLNYALIILGHAYVYPTNSPTPTNYPASDFTNALANGIGLYSFDPHLFDFPMNGINTLSPTAAVMTKSFTFFNTSHFISKMHSVNPTYIPNNDVINFPNFTDISPWQIVQNGTLLNQTVLIKASDAFNSQTANLMEISTYNGNGGRIVRWNDYSWMFENRIGPLAGMDDVVWRSIVWAAKKPFVLQGMPAFVTMRVDDVEGTAGPITSVQKNFEWVKIANEYGIRPWLGTFNTDIGSSELNVLKGLVNNDLATASPHAFSKSYPGLSGTDGHYIYYDHGNYYPVGTFNPVSNCSLAHKFYLDNQLKLSSYFVPHWYEFDPLCLSEVKKMGCEFLVTHMLPGNNYNQWTPWINVGPYRGGGVNGISNSVRPVYYAGDMVLSNGERIYNCCIEIRDDAGYEWFDWSTTPSSVVSVQTGRGIRQLRRALNSMAFSSLFTHEYFFEHVTPSDFRQILAGITANIESDYSPIYTTTDYAAKYTRAKFNIRIADVKVNSACIEVRYIGVNDMRTKLNVFKEQNGTIIQSLIDIPRSKGSGSLIITQ